MVLHQIEPLSHGHWFNSPGLECQQRLRAVKLTYSSALQEVEDMRTMLHFWSAN